jgi:hypothetical protein
VNLVFTTSGTYPWSFVTQISHNGQPSHGGDRITIADVTSYFETQEMFEDTKCGNQKQ